MQTYPFLEALIIAPCGVKRIVICRLLRSKRPVLHDLLLVIVPLHRHVVLEAHSDLAPEAAKLRRGFAAEGLQREGPEGGQLGELRSLRGRRDLVLEEAAGVASLGDEAAAEM